MNVFVYESLASALRTSSCTAVRLIGRFTLVETEISIEPVRNWNVQIAGRNVSANCRNRRIDKLIKPRERRSGNFAHRDSIGLSIRFSNGLRWTLYWILQWTSLEAQRPFESGDAGQRNLKKEETFLNASWSAREVEIPGNERENSGRNSGAGSKRGEF